MPNTPPPQWTELERLLDASDLNALAIFVVELPSDARPRLVAPLSAYVRPRDDRPYRIAGPGAAIAGAGVLPDAKTTAD